MPTNRRCGPRCALLLVALLLWVPQLVRFILFTMLGRVPDAMPLIGTTVLLLVVLLGPALWQRWQRGRRRRQG